MKRFIQFFILMMSVILLNISSLYAQVGIGITNPSSMLHTVAAGSKTATYNGTLLVNDATSTSAGITKTGLSVSSTGTWSGINSVNRGLYVNATGGPTTNNYAAIFEGGPVGIGLTNPASTSILDLTGTGKGILIPRWANTNRPASPATGLLYYQTDQTPGFYYYTGSEWSGPLSTTTGTVTGTATAGQVAYWDDTDNITGSNNLFWDAANSRLGLGTTSPSYMLGLGGNAIRAIAMERNTVANTAGNRLNLQAGGATVSATDKSGGELRLASGLSTGTGSSFISFYTYPAGAAGTTDNAAVEQMRISGAGNIGIGIIPTAAEKVYISEAYTDAAGTGLHSSVSQATTAAATTNMMGNRITVRPNVTSGVTNSGVVYGQYIDANRATATDAGTFTGIAGQRILYGHSSAATGAPTTTSAYGIWLSPYTVTGTITNIYGLYIASPTTGGSVTNHWGVYQAYTSADNYFGGTVGIKNTAPAYPLDVTGVIRSGGPGTDGGLRLYSEIGTTDYELILQPSASMASNVTLTLPANDGNANQILATNGSGVLSWTDDDNSGGTVTSISTTAPLIGGPITTSGTIGITQAGTGSNGYLSSTDWNTFNNKVGGTGATNRVAYWNSASSINDDPDFFFDGTRVGVGLTNPTALFQVYGGELANIPSFSTYGVFSTSVALINDATTSSSNNVILGGQSTVKPKVDGSNNYVYPGNSQGWNGCVSGPVNINQIWAVGSLGTFYATSASSRSWRGVVGNIADITIGAPDGDITVSVHARNPRTNTASDWCFLAEGVQSGGNHNWTNTSDVRLKKNIQGISGALDKVLRLRGVTYEYKQESFTKTTFPAGPQIGFIAQEVQEIVPEAVKSGCFRFEDSSESYAGMTYATITPLLVEAVKEQQKIIESLQQTILGMQQEKSQLKAENDEFKARLSGIETKLNRILGTENPTALNGK